ncbi:MAG: hypothetical protein ACK4UJ_08155 [Leptonema sp. (in: bacteria)]
MQIKVFNQTKKIPTIVDSLEIIEITEEGLKPMFSYTSVGPMFSLTIKQKSPLLIRANYKGEVYNTFVLEKELGNSIIKKQIDVYETTSQIDNLFIHSGIQITKNEEGLDVNFIYVFQNRGNRAILPDVLYFSIPENAKNIQATINYEFSQVPLRISLKEVFLDQQKYYTLNRTIKPGNAELFIQFQLDGYTFSNSIDPIWKKIRKSQEEKFFRVFMWKPVDIQPEITGGRIEKKQMENLSDAYFIYYDSETIHIDFTKGNFIYKNPMKSYKNPIFDTTFKTTLGIILGLLLVFLFLGFVSLNKKFKDA